MAGKLRLPVVIVVRDTHLGLKYQLNRSDRHVIKNVSYPGWAVSVKTTSKLTLGIFAAVTVVLLLFVGYISDYSPQGRPLPVGRALQPDSKSTLSMPLPTSTPTPSLDPLAAVDRILERMEPANIAFNSPKSMNLHDTAVIQLLLGVETSIKELKQLVEAEGEKAGASIRVSNRMEARLTGPNFSITSITSEIQAVSRTGVINWRWEIKPKNIGRQFLHLTLSAILNVEGVTTPRTIRTFDKVIEVQVTWNQKVMRFVKNNWQWLWAVMVAPIAGWFWKRRKPKTKRSSNKNNS